MGALCDWAVGSLVSLWQWFFPPEEEMPECVREWLEELFPNVDFDRVHLHDGLPPIVRISGPGAITLPGAAGVSDVHIYFRDGLPDPCDCDGLALYAHEVVHVQQYSDYAGGYGLGLFRAFLYVYLLCSLRHGYEHNPLEQEASDFEQRVRDCCEAARIPCDCAGDEPQVDPAGLRNWREHCGDLVFRETAVGFFEHAWGCTPGLEWWWDAVESVFGACGQFRQSADSRVLSAFVCLFTTLLAGVMAILGIVYFLGFSIVFLAVTLAILAVWTVLKVVYLAVSAIWAIVAGLLCALDYLWQAITWLAEKIWQAITWLAGRIREGLVTACNWANDLERRCVEWREERIRECKEYRTEKRKECRKHATERRKECREYRTEKRKECKKKAKKRKKDCCNWWPCSWGCDAWNWIVKTVCVAYHWITEKVCVAWEYIKQTVCVAYHWVTEKVCVAYHWVVSRSCEAFAWVVTGATCWAR